MQVRYRAALRPEMGIIDSGGGCKGKGKTLWISHIRFNFFLADFLKIYGLRIALHRIPSSLLTVAPAIHLPCVKPSNPFLQQILNSNEEIYRGDDALSAIDPGPMECESIRRFLQLLW